MSDPNVRIPRALYIAMRKAIRAGARDSRRNDRVLHDETRDLFESANDAIEDYQDSRGPIR